MAPSAVQSFSVERTVMPSNIGTAYDTSIPPNILASLAAGALEIRERLIYNPQVNTLTSTVFLVEPGSPNPTPIGVDILAMTLESLNKEHHTKLLMSGATQSLLGSKVETVHRGEVPVRGKAVPINLYTVTSLVPKAVVNA